MPFIDKMPNKYFEELAAKKQRAWSAYEEARKAFDLADYNLKSAQKSCRHNWKNIGSGLEANILECRNCGLEDFA